VSARSSNAPSKPARRSSGNPRRHGVHDAADGSTAIEQRHRTAEDLDLVGRERFHGHRVIVADGGHIRGAQTVFERLHAGAGEAADDRPRRAGAEVRRADAELSAQRLAEIAGASAIELIAAQDGDGLCEIGHGAIARHAGHDNLVRSFVRLCVRERTKCCAEEARHEPRRCGPGQALRNGHYSEIRG
jgi:hypothetical protein